MTMIDPPLTELMQNVDSRYTLVVATAKRARQLVDGAEKLCSCESNKPVSVAVNEIYKHKIEFENPEGSLLTGVVQ